MVKTLRAQHADSEPITPERIGKVRVSVGDSCKRRRNPGRIYEDDKLSWRIHSLGRCLAGSVRMLNAPLEEMAVGGLSTSGAVLDGLIHV